MSNRNEYYRRAQSERYAWAKEVDGKAVEAFEKRAKEQRLAS